MRDLKEEFMQGVRGSCPRGWVGLLAVVIFAIAPVGGGASGAVIGEQIDQALLTPQPLSSTAVSMNQSLGQTFTNSIDGFITRLELQLGRNPGTTLPLQVSVRKTVGNQPDLSAAALLFATTLDAAAIPVESFSTTYTASIEVPLYAVPVDPGDKLALMLSTGGDWYHWSSSGANMYGGGTGLHRFTSSSGPFTVQTNTDYGFRTWVAIPEPTSALAPAGIALLALIRRRG